MSSALDDITNDKSQEAASFKRKVRDGYFLLIVGLASIIAIYHFGNNSMYVGLIPGFALGVASTSIGVAFRVYKSKKGSKNEVNKK